MESVNLRRETTGSFVIPRLEGAKEWLIEVGSPPFLSDLLFWTLFVFPKAVYKIQFCVTAFVKEICRAEEVKTTGILQSCAQSAENGASVGTECPARQEMEWEGIQDNLDHAGWGGPDRTWTEVQSQCLKGKCHFRGWTTWPERQLGDTWVTSRMGPLIQDYFTSFKSFLECCFPHETDHPIYNTTSSPLKCPPHFSCCSIRPPLSPLTYYNLHTEIVYDLLSAFPQECQFHTGRDFYWFCSMTFPKCLEPCPAYSKCSINSCWRNALLEIPRLELMRSQASIYSQPLRFAL